MTTSTPLRIAFAGTPEFAAVALQALLDSEHEVVVALTQPDRPAGRGRQPQASAVKQAAVAADVPVWQPLHARSCVSYTAFGVLKYSRITVTAMARCGTDSSRYIGGR